MPRKKRKKKSRGLSALEKTPSGRSAGPRGKRSDYPGVSFTPPKSVQAAARKGLRLREKMAKRRSRPGGTDIGVARANQLASGRAVWPRTVRRMKGYFARHSVDKRAKGWGDNNNPSPGYVAWLLWGGDPGEKWAKKTFARMQKVKKNPERNMAVEALTVINGPMEGIEQNGGDFYGVNPKWIGVGAIAGAIMSFRRAPVKGAAEGALIGAGLSFLWSCLKDR